MVDGLHAVHEGQDEVPDLLLVAVVVPQVDVVRRLVHKDGCLHDLQVIFKLVNFGKEIY